MQAGPPPIRDIAAAPPPPWWPPAWGWWVVGALAMMAVLLGIGLWVRHRRQQQRIALLGREVDDIAAQWRDTADIRTAVSRVSTYLRRLVLHEAGERKAAALTGQAWVDFLTAPEDLDPDLAVAARELIHAPYQPEPRVNVDSLLELCRFWLRRVAHV